MSPCIFTFPHFRHFGDKRGLSQGGFAHSPLASKMMETSERKDTRTLERKCEDPCLREIVSDFMLILVLRIRMIIGIGRKYSSRERIYDVDACPILQKERKNTSYCKRRNPETISKWKRKKGIENISGLSFFLFSSSILLSF